MQLTQAQKIAVGLLAIIVLGGGIWYFVARGGESTPAPAANTGTPTTTNATSTTGATGTSTSSPQKESVADLINKGNDAYRRGDYTTARKSWEAAIAIAPENTNALVSLASVHTTQLKDYAKAETYYKKAASSIVPSYSAATYQLLIDFYTNTGYKSNTTVLEDALKQAIQRNPKAVNFYVVLARLYKDAGRIADAKAQFDAAITAAGTNTTLVAQLQTEKDSF